MIFKLKYTGKYVSVGSPINAKVNGVVNRILGPNNKWYGNTSSYCVSPMKKFTFYPEDKVFSYEGDVFFLVASPNPSFIKDFIENIIEFENSRDELSIMSLKYVGFEMMNMKVNETFDIVYTFGPVRLVNEGLFVTFTDEGFVDLLTERCKLKLEENGFSKEEVDSLSIELISAEKARVIKTYIRDSINITSKVMLRISGQKEVRKALYQLGIGSSTSVGFGFVIPNSMKI